MHVAAGNDRCDSNGRSTTGPIDESVYTGSADTGSNFRISSCQYIYNLSASALGVGTYRVDILINNQVVGSATFQLSKASSDSALSEFRIHRSGATCKTQAAEGETANTAFGVPHLCGLAQVQIQSRPEGGTPNAA